MTEPSADSNLEPFVKSSDVLSNAPTKATDSHWYWAHKAEGRANALQRDVDRLGAENASLKERLRSVETQHRLAKGVSTGLIALAGMMAAIALYLASSGQTEVLLAWGAGGFAALFLIAGVTISWLPLARQPGQKD